MNTPLFTDLLTQKSASSSTPRRGILDLGCLRKINNVHFNGGFSGKDAGKPFSNHSLIRIDVGVQLWAIHTPPQMNFIKVVILRDGHARKQVSKFIVAGFVEALFLVRGKVETASSESIEVSLPIAGNGLCCRPLVMKAPEFRAVKRHVNHVECSHMLCRKTRGSCGHQGAENPVSLRSFSAASFNNFLRLNCKDWPKQGSHNRKPLARPNALLNYFRRHFRLPMLFKGIVA
jgi:hypothetical protein